MNKRESVRTAIAAGVAGIGLSVGAVAMAAAGESPTTEVIPAAPAGDREHGDRRDHLAGALAESFGISADKITAALDELHDERRAEGRALLSERLDPTVEDGDLTAADKSSVLKAYDAGVLGGPGGHGFGGPFGGHRGPGGH